MNLNIKTRKATTLLLLLATLLTVGGCQQKTRKRHTERPNDYRPTTAEPVAGKFIKEGEIIITPPASDSVLARIDVEVANTPQRRQKGLMHRQQLAGNQGMYFIFERKSWQSFWMKNTFIPLDIIFIDDKNIITNIHANTQPLSEASYPSTQPAQFVLEVNGGYCKANNIAPGCKITFTPTTPNS